jgi:hypothetical protein
MTTEWLALWIHFQWSGVFTTTCCLALWWKIGLIAAPSAVTHLSHVQQHREQHRTLIESTPERRRLLKIAGMMSVCVSLNVIASVSTSATLQEWSRTADISLACEIKETRFSRAWDMYGFHDDTVVKVCSAEDATTTTGSSCVDSCTWNPEITVMTLVCAKALNGNVMALDQVATLVDLSCDCPCGSLITIHKPRYTMRSGRLVPVCVCVK